MFQNNTNKQKTFILNVNNTPLSYYFIYIKHKHVAVIIDF
jgi:hypothetical protein